MNPATANLPSPLFARKAVIGMVHVQALPGSPMASRSIAQIAALAAEEARVFKSLGFDGLIVENMHDRPYVQPPHAPETIAAMTIAVHAVRVAFDGPIGVQILSCGEREALAVALATGAQFVRCENFVYAHVADEGVLERAAAGPLLRYRRNLGAEHIRLVCDVKKKHASHAITSDISLEDAVHGAEFFGADAVVVSGAFTGSPTSPGDVARARNATALPVFVGSGVTPEQIGTLLQNADALIVGSYIKVGGVWSAPLDADRCRAIIAAADAARG